MILAGPHSFYSFDLGHGLSASLAPKGGWGGSLGTSSYSCCGQEALRLHHALRLHCGASAALLRCCTDTWPAPRAAIEPPQPKAP